LGNLLKTVTELLNEGRTRSLSQSSNGEEAKRNPANAVPASSEQLNYFEIVTHIRRLHFHEKA
jgi:hypothetical protein